MSTSLPLGFEAASDLASGKSYVDAIGNRVDRSLLNRELAKEGSGSHIVSLSVEYRQPGSAVEAPLKRVTIRREVVGALDTDTLGRVIHDSTRTVYDRLRESGTTGLGSLEGVTDDDEDDEEDEEFDEEDELSRERYGEDDLPDVADSIDDSGTPEEVFVIAITIT